MPFEAEAPLRDIEHHINLATQFVAGLKYEEFPTHAPFMRSSAALKLFQRHLVAFPTR
jgi:hypothetical protein